MKAKTKIWLQRIITCHCNQCVKKKWSRYQKKTSPRLKVAFIGVLIAFLVIDTIGNWYENTWNEDRWNFINETNAGSLEILTNDSSTTSPVVDTKSHSDIEDLVQVETKTMGSAAPVAPQVEVISKYFPNETKLALAIAKAESSLNPEAKGWNCYYWYNSKRYSGACKPEDRKDAWSVDCGLFQINVKGQECPKELYDIEHNAKVAKSMRESNRGWAHWWTYNTGKYVKFL